MAPVIGIHTDTQENLGPTWVKRPAKLVGAVAYNNNHKCDCPDFLRLLSKTVLLALPWQRQGSLVEGDKGLLEGRLLWGLQRAREDQGSARSRRDIP